jgi:alpha-glucosidase
VSGPSWVPPGTAGSSWWRRASTIYQIYPSSYFDANGDGVGDFEGIRSKLPHLAGLGVDATWLSPIYPSGGVDGGYDVTDYQDVDPRYGDLGAFDRLLHDAHQIGIRVLLDFVPNHTSHRHPWFVESSGSRESPKRDWYIWREPAPGGGPPNDWMSAFGGSAWRWEERTGQYVLATFYPQQVDLNWENPQVRATVTSAMRWWIDRGVDGFRLDVIHRLSKGPGLSDGPRSHEFVRQIRHAVGPDALLLGEVWLFDPTKVVPYLAPGELDLAFAFPFAFSTWDPRALGEVVDRVGREWSAAGAWPCWHVGNHDMPRPATRWGPGAVRAGAVLQLTLPGVAIVYQGDEVGMEDGDVPPDRRVDRMGRDGCRTPMRWDREANGGFCPPDVQPWLPVGDCPPGATVVDQGYDPDSVLVLYRRLLRLRRDSPALNHGAFRVLSSGAASGLVFERTAREERLVVAVNVGARPTVATVPEGVVRVATSVAREGLRVGGDVFLEANEALAVQVV